MTLAELHQLRSEGSKPDCPLFLTLVPELHRYIPEQTISVSLGDDFAPVTGLRVWLCFHSSQIETAFAIVDQILREDPFDLVFWGLDRGRAENIVEHGIRTETRAVPNETLRPIMEHLKCD